MNLRGGRRLRARDLWVVAVPVALVLTISSVAAVMDYSVLVRFDDWWSRTRSLGSLLAGRIGTAVRAPRAVLLRDGMDPASDDDFVIRLNVDRDLWDRAVAQPFLGDPDWVDATLVREGGVQEVRVRRRGDTSVHWTTPKTSFTLRTDRWEPARGYREVAISGKEVLTADIANWVPAQLGLLTPSTDVTAVYLNEQFYGLFRVVELPDESLLRRNSRLPGNFFRADAAERGEYYKGVPRNVFVNPYIWDRVAVSNAATDNPFATLHRFLEAVQSTTPDGRARLFDIVERDEIARLIASMLLVGDPYHMSGVHNQLWYEDPSTGRLHPVPWDLRLLRLGAPRGPVSDFLSAAIGDPFVTDAALRHAVNAIETGLLDRAEDRIRATAERFAPYLEYERLRRELISPPGEPDEMVALLRANGETVRRWAGESTIRHVIGPGDDVPLDLQLEGFAGFDLLALRTESPAGAPSVYMDSDLDGRLGPSDRRLSATMNGDSLLVLDQALPLHGAWQATRTGIQPGAATYRLFVRGARPLGVRARNRATGTESVSAPAPGELRATGLWHAWRFERPRGRTVRLAGTRLLNETLRVGPADTLVVAAGARLRLGPSVSVISRGRVLLSGTAERPIRVEPAEPDRPWGAFVLQDSGASRSVIRHVVFRGGGGARVGAVDYKGMVSVHRADSVLLDGVRLEDNRVSDDALNAVHASDLELRDCTFLRANGDAVDFDFSSGVIDQCEFLDSTNDAIDLMGSSPRITRTRITGSGDKGISVGERSHPFVGDVSISNSSRGMEVKDRSRPLIVDTDLTGNQVGLLLQVKNWRYGGGGWARVIGSAIEENQRDIVIDDLSHLSRLEDTPPGRPGSSAIPSDVFADRDAAGRPVPRRPVWQLPPSGGFDETVRGWHLSGESRARRFADGLEWVIERGDAVLERPVDLEVAPPGGVLAVALSARNLERLRLVAVRAEGPETSFSVPAADTAGTVDLVLLDLPAGRYEGLRFDAGVEPGPGVLDPITGLVERRTARLRLYDLQVFDMSEAMPPQDTR